MGPWIDEKTADIETLLEEFENACRAGDHEYAPEYKGEILRRLASNQGEAARLRETLERTLGALYAKNSGIPIRDLDETIAEAEKALSSHTEDTGELERLWAENERLLSDNKQLREAIGFQSMMDKGFRRKFSTEDTGIQKVREPEGVDKVRKLHAEWVDERKNPRDPNFPGYSGIVENRIAQIEEVAEILGITIPGITDGGDTNNGGRI